MLTNERNAKLNNEFLMKIKLSAVENFDKGVFIKIKLLFISHDSIYMKGLE